MCVDALLELGYEKEVNKTIAFAFAAFEKKGRVTQQVGWNDAFDFPNTPSDALAHILRTLLVTKYKLTQKQRTFLEKEIERYFSLLR